MFQEWREDTLKKREEDERNFRGQQKKTLEETVENFRKVIHFNFNNVPDNTF